jgi:hypothetical protein
MPNIALSNGLELGAVVSPLRHQLAALCEGLAPSIGKLRAVPRLMRKRHLSNFPTRLRLVAARVAEG